jgi:hypothetical protein
MAQRRIERAQEAREEIRHVVGFSVADELNKLEALRNSGTITPDEFMRLRARLVQ